MSDTVQREMCLNLMTRVYAGLCGFTGLRGFTRVYAGLRGFTRVDAGWRGLTRVYGFTRVYRFAGFRDVYDLRCVVVLSCLRKRNHVMFWEGCHQEGIVSHLCTTALAIYKYLWVSFVFVIRRNGRQPFRRLQTDEVAKTTTTMEYADDRRSWGTIGLNGHGGGNGKWTKVLTQY